MRKNLLALVLSVGMLLGVATDAGAVTVVHHSRSYYAAQARARRARRARAIRHRRHVNTAKRVGIAAAGGAAIGALAAGGKGAGIGAIAGAGAGALYDQHQKHKGRQ